MLKKGRYIQLVRYIVAGGLAYVFELTLLLSLKNFAHFSAELSTAIAFWVGLFTAFVLQKTFAFNDYRKEAKLISQQLGLYLALVLFNYIFTLVFISLFDDSLIVVSRTVALAIVTVWNYAFYKYLFRNDKHTKMTKLFDKLNKKTHLLVASVKANWIWIFVPFIIIITFFWQYTATGSRLIGGDFDYYAQMYEAFRISILKFHQFPSYNPWMSGGIPLYQNPQFGLISIQSIFVILLGTIRGLKLAYVVYAVCGYVGMYFLGRKVFKASKLRSLLVGLLWIFGGFFAGHGISHFTFSLFFLFPWIIYFLIKWRVRYSWLYLGVLLSAIVLSSLHYGFLMMGMASLMFFPIYILVGNYNNKFNLQALPVKDFVKFSIKTLGVFVLLSGYRIITTYLFLSNNSRPAAVLGEAPPGVNILLEALFLPIGTVFKIPTGIQWGWGEYSAYAGMGVTITVAVIIIGLIKQKRTLLTKKERVILTALLFLGLISFLLAIGNVNEFSPYNMLRKLPGFSQTRVSSRWLVFVSFSLLSLIVAWKRNRALITFLLTLSIIELYIFYGPVHVPGSNQAVVPDVKNINPIIKQIDTREMVRAEVQKNLSYSYYYSTIQNIGQIYADDSIINTLNKVLGTNKCGENKISTCSFVLSDNADVLFWSPNKIILKRTAPGVIELNMNVDNSWKINNKYLFGHIKNLDPTLNLTIQDDDANTYNLEYSPKLSPSWLLWKPNNIRF